MVKVKMVKMTPGTGIFTHYKIYINIYLYSADFSVFGTDFDQNDFDHDDKQTISNILKKKLRNKG